MKILHTSDWHLGRTLYNKKRYEEFEAFLDWLYEKIIDEHIDLLLVAGDIFDTTTPGNRAQELYYRFLSRLSNSCCRNVVIIGGNHDSPTFLEAPKHLLNILNVHVVGAISENVSDEVIEIKDENQNTSLIVCAVPFLRDRDIRSVGANESMSDKDDNLREGIARHYQDVKAHAMKIRGDKQISIVGMGHLFTRDGKTNEGDGVRELYIGSLAHVDSQSLADGFDYLALGHLHLAQKVGNSEYARYSGSPIPMGFGEINYEKKVLVVNISEEKIMVEDHVVPSFQSLEKISGDIEEVSKKLELLKSKDEEIWLEIELTKNSSASDINTAFEAITAGSMLEILRIKNKTLIKKALHRGAEEETLDSLNHEDVFERCLGAHEIDEENRKILVKTYQEAYHSMLQIDSNAE